MVTQSTGGADASNHLAHEQRLAAALRDLVRQIKISDYRDSLDHRLHDNFAYLQAQAVVERFGLTHEVLCETLEDCDLAGDLAETAHKIFEARQARPDDVPPEYDTWTTGP